MSTGDGGGVAYHATRGATPKPNKKTRIFEVTT
jgi:hypothetical protein